MMSHTVNEEKALEYLKQAAKFTDDKGVLYYIHMASAYLKASIKAKDAQV